MRTLTPHYVQNKKNENSEALLFRNFSAYNLIIFILKLVNNRIQDSLGTADHSNDSLATTKVSK